MTTASGGGDSKKGAGYLKEKFMIGIGKVTGDEVDVAIMKATSHKLKAPNEKYSQRLLAASYGHCKFEQKQGLTVNDYIVRELEKRSHTHNWIVVLKSMIMFHRLMRDGSEEINLVMQRNRNVFCFRNIKELADSPDGAAQKSLIEEYIRYLEERVVTHSKLPPNQRMESEEFRQMLTTIDVETLPTYVDLLLRQLEALVLVEYRDMIVDNWCTLEVYTNVLVDSRRLYQLLSNRFIFILDGFEEFPLKLKETWLALYRRFGFATEKLSETYTSMSNSRKVFVIPVPSLKPFPPSLLERLQDDVRYSSIPTEDVTCTLESLGISSAKEEELPKTSEAVQSKDVNAAATTPASNAGAVAPVDAPPPTTQIPAIVQPPPQPQVLDDLFGGAWDSKPASGQQNTMMPVGASQAPPASGNDGMWSSGAPTAPAFDPHPAPTGFDDMSYGQPGTISTRLRTAGNDEPSIDSYFEKPKDNASPNAWSTGVPQSVPSPGFDAAPLPTSSPFPGSVPSANAIPAQTQSQSTARPDPFRDLMFDGQRQFNSSDPKQQ